jgi:hypothetical protein
MTEEDMDDLTDFMKRAYRDDPARQLMVVERQA